MLVFVNVSLSVVKMWNGSVTCRPVTFAFISLASLRPFLTAVSEKLEPSVGIRMCLNMLPPLGVNGFLTNGIGGRSRCTLTEIKSPVVLRRAFQVRGEQDSAALQSGLDPGHTTRVQFS